MTKLLPHPLLTIFPWLFIWNATESEQNVHQTQIHLNSQCNNKATFLISLVVDTELLHMFGFRFLPRFNATDWERRKSWNGVKLNLRKW